ncbi:16S rRNA (uracil(1498)-N(3))-methyltransferase [Parafilimonas terrae]|uniref:Ribosomal RNA small subunit methyltransferase E n=1 Tax=Parafilimonas terrae TaxID=1465490 RepID=A0A1I5XRA6_9BACT|nr:16S rRNA (uracil(1498)-N(3))-methyltransferase [Parafilimonas terrae]SFQ34356.1 16S rRNA (uracil1498-N3)-methyltransferase [Parafilimonas terrae]
MNLPYFYEENIQQLVHVLSEETSKHCVQVLRMKAGEELQLTDGKGSLFTATIINADKKHCGVKMEAASLKLQAAGNVSIAISLLKNPSRFEWFLEKATEIGVSEIIPLICEHTEKEHFRFDRMHNILISAMLQSRQTWLPHLHQPKKFNAFINEGFDGIKLIAHCVEEEKKTVTQITAASKNKLILIGPEGDFSATEISNALEKNFIPVTLGNTRLRTETAGVVAAALLVNMG